MKARASKLLRRVRAAFWKIALRCWKPKPLLVEGVQLDTSDHNTTVSLAFVVDWHGVKRRVGIRMGKDAAKRMGSELTSLSRRLLVVP